MLLIKKKIKFEVLTFKQQLVVDFLTTISSKELHLYAYS